MNIINSIIGIFLLAILVVIGYKVGQIAIELNTPVIPKTNTAEIAIPEQPSSTSVRWNHFPLTIYINDNFIIQKNPGYLDDVRQALEMWESTGIVSFFVTTSPDADIMIEWVPNLKEKSLDTLGNTDLKFINTSQFGIIQNATIQLLSKSESRQLSSIDMANLALHEIGHTIGLQHTNEDDIMNPVLVIPSKTVKEISSSDIKNLQELYKVPAKADLRIAEINATKSTFKRFGQNYFYLNLSIDLQNIGLVTAKNFTIKLDADNVVVNELEQAELEPGKILTLFQGNLRIDRNFTSLQVNIDPENLIDELNETNNFVEIQVS